MIVPAYLLFGQISMSTFSGQMDFTVEMCPDEKAPGHQQISSELLTEILAARYDHADRLSSEAQLVERFNVSRPTMARALLDLKTKGILERRAGSGTCRCKGCDGNPTIGQPG